MIVSTASSPRMPVGRMGGGGGHLPKIQVLVEIDKRGIRSVYGELSPADACGLLQFALEHQACVSAEQMKVCNLMLSFFADRDFKNIFEGIDWKKL